MKSKGTSRVNEIRGKPGQPLTESDHELRRALREIPPAPQLTQRLTAIPERVTSQTAAAGPSCGGYVSTALFGSPARLLITTAALAVIVIGSVGWLLQSLTGESSSRLAEPSPIVTTDGNDEEVESQGELGNQDALLAIASVEPSPELLAARQRVEQLLRLQQAREFAEQASQKTQSLRAQGRPLFVAEDEREIRLAALLVLSGDLALERFEHPHKTDDLRSMYTTAIELAPQSDWADLAAAKLEQLAK